MTTCQRDLAARDGSRWICTHRVHNADGHAASALLRAQRQTATVQGEAAAGPRNRSSPRTLARVLGDAASASGGTGVAVPPTPATHAIWTVLKTGETVYLMNKV